MCTLEKKQNVLCQKSLLHLNKQQQQKKGKIYEKKVQQKFTINDMKCSAVKRDFWCLKNKVNQIQRHFLALFSGRFCIKNWLRE